MRNLTSVIMAGLFTFLLISPETMQAQGTNKNRLIKLQPNSSESSSINAEMPAIMVNDRAFNDFRKTYSAATGETWSATENGFIAVFQENGVRCHAYYNKKGHWNGTIRYLFAKDIPEDIRAAARYHFPGFTLGIAQELSLPFDLFYFLYMEKGQHFKRVKYSNGAMEILEDSVK